MSTRHKTLVATFVVVLPLTIYALDSTRKHRLRTVTTAASSVKVVPAPQDKESADKGTRVPSHVLTLRPNGFEPAEVSWPSESFFLAIDNRTRITDLTLQLDRKQGGRLKEVNLKSRKQRSAGLLNLRPGQYVLTERNHPQWVCRITITAK